MAPRPRDLLARDAYLNVVRLHERLDGEFEELFRQAGLSGAQYNVLRILRGAPREGLACQAIGERLLTRVPDVTRLLDRLEAAGLVTRRRSEEDRRVVLTRLTRAGRALLTRLDEPVAALHRRQFAGMPAAALATLNRALEQALALPV
jgi:DNA-binding MarR family transcriptional regulator